MTDDVPWKTLFEKSNINNLLLNTKSFYQDRKEKKKFRFHDLF